MASEDVRDLEQRTIFIHTKLFYTIGTNSQHEIKPQQFCLKTYVIIIFFIYQTQCIKVHITNVSSKETLSI